LADPLITNKTYKSLITPAFLTKWASLIVLVLLLAVIGVWNFSFFLYGNSETVLILTSFFLMAALGQTWVIMLGSIDLSAGFMVSLSSVVFALTISDLGYWSIAIVFLLGLVGGLLNGVVFTFLRIPSFIATLGTGGIFLSLAYVLSNGGTVSIRDISSPALSIWNETVLGIPVLIFFVFLVWTIFFIYQRFTIGGRMIYYIGSSESTAWMSGIHVLRHKILAFAMSGITAALTGILLVGEIQNGNPTMGQPFLLNSAAAVVIGGTALTGGVGGVGKTLIGALIIAILSNGMNVVGVDAYFQSIVTGAIIILAAAMSLDRSKISMIK
jgi:ribose transport system permease protein